MNHSLRAVPALLFLSIGLLSAQPNISFDTKEFDCGMLVEGKTDKIDAVFIIRNTGNEPLRLITVRPGCGCTDVKFDSLIQPGKSTRMTSQVNIKGYRSGPVSKGITVTSNAPNDSTVRLTIKATITSPVDASLQYIDMTSRAQAPDLLLKTARKGFAVTQVSFSPDHSGTGDSPLKSVPVNVSFSLAPDESAAAGDTVSYRLVMKPLPFGTPTDGSFIITTNHPDKRELRIRGRVE